MEVGQNKLMYYYNIIANEPVSRLHTLIGVSEALGNICLRVVPHGIFKHQNLTGFVLSRNWTTGGHGEMGDLPATIFIGNLDDSTMQIWHGASG